jgi:hypothetical protein
MAAVGPTGRKIPLGEAIAGVSGILLFIFLFLPWVGASGGLGSSGSATGWEIYTIADLVLAILGLGTAALVLMRFVGATVRLPAPRTRLMKWFSVISLTIVLTTVIELSTGDPGKLFSLKIGGILAALAAIGMLVGAILAERPELADRLAAATAGAGGGGGAPTRQMPPVGGGVPSAAPPVQQQPAASPPAAGATSVGQVQPAPEPVAPATPEPPANVAADWYPDPRGEKRLRYWDGSRWTDHTAD